MRIVAISDFHGILPQNIPECDVLLVGGDISPFNIQRNPNLMEDWITIEFKKWVKEQPCEKVVLIAGNHDYYLNSLTGYYSRKEFDCLFDDKLIYLLNEYYEIDIKGEKIRIFGTPFCHKFGDWPFMFSESHLTRYFAHLDMKVDILLTHDPVWSLGTTDCVLRPKYKTQDPTEHLGGKELFYRLMSLYDQYIQPEYVLCGHIHSGNHILEEHLGMKCINVSLMDEVCDKLIYSPFEFKI